MNRRSVLEFSDGAAGPLLASESDADWRDAALCAQSDGDAWFPEKGGSTARVKRICRACPVRESCLEFALENREPFGVWGGLSEEERRPLLRERAAFAGLRRCKKNLHVMTEDNITCDGKCRTCKNAYERGRTAGPRDCDKEDRLAKTADRTQAAQAA